MNTEYLITFKNARAGKVTPYIEKFSNSKDKDQICALGSMDFFGTNINTNVGLYNKNGDFGIYVSAEKKKEITSVVGKLNKGDFIGEKKSWIKGKSSDYTFGYFGLTRTDVKELDEQTILVQETLW